MTRQINHEDQDAMEMDLDKDESLRPEGNELSGERLLMTEYLAIPGASAKSRRKDVVSARFEPLQRPVTPSQRKAAEAGIPTINGSHPETASKDLVRPPTRSGSRPNTQESVREPTSSRPESSQSAKAKTATKTAETNLSTPVAVEYSKAFGSRPKIPRTPDPKSQKRPTSRGSISSMPPQPQFSESGPRPSSAGKSGNGSVSPRKASAGSHGRGGDVKS
ncbi:hypothetical protein CHS0354_019996 [Potamilus streckersoni]|uniref:Uncharacterized protein n=1 Tax=Potamilus streckersoni TaxID=2493646 RepID=A0AAE0VQL0_9BIVA|nr:hypothetical protein CHS0354_019996 [Potamilus streckersoni]